MLGLIMMSAPLAIAVGLSTVAITHGRARRFGRLCRREGPNTANQGASMKIILAALAASAFLTGCVSNSGLKTQPPNYVTSQAHQMPAIRNDAFGGAAMPMRGLPR